MERVAINNATRRRLTPWSAKIGKLSRVDSASWILGAMGPLQFDVMQHRLKSEYGVDLTLSPLPYTLARWPQAGFDPDDFRYSERIRVVLDRDDRWALLAQSSWDFDRLTERNESLELSETPDPSLFESANATLY